MKRPLVCSLVLVVCTLCLLPASSFAQTKTSEQSLQELVTEVRQLRATLQRLNAAVYKSQVMLERVKLQQEQVTRLERELRDTRENLSDLRSHQLRITEILGRVEAGIEAGVINEKERTSLKGELEVISQREQRASSRETQLANELETERAKLNELNDKLNLLVEREL